MASAGEERDRVLQSLRGWRFDRISFRGLDAVVIHVPDDTAEPPQAIRDRDASRQPWRLYPVDRTHLVKWPYTGGEVPDGCTVEPGGWDHEHCDGCNGLIRAGQSFWQTVDEPCTWLCSECYLQLQRLEGAERDGGSGGES